MQCAVEWNSLSCEAWLWSGGLYTSSTPSTMKLFVTLFCSLLLGGGFDGGVVVAGRGSGGFGAVAVAVAVAVEVGGGIGC
jgi:hypothetical protein